MVRGCAWEGPDPVSVPDPDPVPLPAAEQLSITFSCLKWLWRKVVDVPGLAVVGNGGGSQIVNLMFLGEV